jgi:pimeloyl-ACP methyl ester carboxylesterase
MRVQVGDVRLYVDVDGPKLVPDGPWMRERPTVVLLHPGPGFDHALYKIQIGPWLAAGTQVVYFDMRGAGRSDPGRPEDLRLEQWADDLLGLCEALRIEQPIVLGLGFGALVALDYAARYPEHPGALVLAAPVARMDPERSIAVYERLGGAEAADAARGFYGELDQQSFADFLRVCFPLLSGYEQTSDVIVRAHWNPAVLIGWMRGEAKTVDVRDELARVRAPALVLAGEDDAWAPLESAREVAELLGASARFRSFPGARHSIFRDEPQAYETLRLFLDDVQAGAGAGA